VEFWSTEPGTVPNCFGKVVCGFKMLMKTMINRVCRRVPNTRGFVLSVYDLYDSMPEEMIREREEIMKDYQDNDLASLDLQGFNVVTKVSVNPKDAFYYGGVFSLRAPKPLHIGTKSQDSKKAITVSSMETALENGFFDGDQPQRKNFQEEIILKMGYSNMVQYKDILLPLFDDLPELDGRMNPLEVSWRLIQECFNKKEPIRGRVMNRMNGGFAVALGPLIAFLPQSHLSPWMKGQNTPRWEERTNRVLGQELWFLVLKTEIENRNVVVSHKLLPDKYIAPMLKQQPHSTPSSFLKRESLAAKLAEGSSSREGEPDSPLQQPHFGHNHRRVNYFSSTQVTNTKPRSRNLPGMQPRIRNAEDLTPIVPSTKDPKTVNE